MSENHSFFGTLQAKKAHIINVIEYKLQQGNQDMLTAIVASSQRILKHNQTKTDFNVKEVKNRSATTAACVKYKEYIRPFIEMVRDTNDTSKYRILYNLSLKLIEYVLHLYPIAN